jgi:large subunit ribosomal protein L25
MGGLGNKNAYMLFFVETDNSWERSKMDQIEITATRRTAKRGEAKRLREKGQVPAILYGLGAKNVPLAFEILDLTRTLSQAGASQLIHLRIDDGSTTQPVLAREIQRDVLSGEPIHVDFLAVSMTERITAEVSITLVGEPGAASAGIGVLLQGANTVEIECLPGDLIPSFEVDVSDVELNSAIYIGDLDLPGSITMLSDPQEMVAQVIPERLEEEVEEEEEEFAMEEPAEVEVIARGREDEEDSE